MITETEFVTLTEGIVRRAGASMHQLVTRIEKLETGTLRQDVSTTLPEHDSTSVSSLGTATRMGLPPQEHGDGRRLARRASCTLLG